MKLTGTDMQTGKQDHVLPVKVRACLIKKIVTCPGKNKTLIGTDCDKNPVKFFSLPASQP